MQKIDFVAVSLRLCSALTANHRTESMVRPSLSTTFIMEESADWRSKVEWELNDPSSSGTQTESHHHHFLPTFSCITSSHSSVLSPRSPAEYCIIHSVGEGRRDVGEEGWQRQQGGWLTMQQARTQLNHRNHLMPPSSSQVVILHSWVWHWWL